METQIDFASLPNTRKVYLFSLFISIDKLQNITIGYGLKELLPIRRDSKAIPNSYDRKPPESYGSKRNSCFSNAYLERRLEENTRQGLMECATKHSEKPQGACPKGRTPKQIS